MLKMCKDLAGQELITCLLLYLQRCWWGAVSAYHHGGEVRGGGCNTSTEAGAGRPRVPPRQEYSTSRCQGQSLIIISRETYKTLV